MKVRGIFGNYVSEEASGEPSCQGALKCPPKALSISQVLGMGPYPWLTSSEGRIREQMEQLLLPNPCSLSLCHPPSLDKSSEPGKSGGGRAWTMRYQEEGHWGIISTPNSPFIYPPLSPTLLEVSRSQTSRLLFPLILFPLFSHLPLPAKSLSELPLHKMPDYSRAPGNLWVPLLEGASN